MRGKTRVYYTCATPRQRRKSFLTASCDTLLYEEQVIQVQIDESIGAGVREASGWDGGSGAQGAPPAAGSDNGSQGESSATADAHRPPLPPAGPGRGINQIAAAF